MTLRDFTEGCIEIISNIHRSATTRTASNRRRSGTRTELPWNVVSDTNMISELLLVIKFLNSEALRVSPLAFKMPTERKFKFVVAGNLSNRG